jgi:hypothetical protein
MKLMGKIFFMTLHVWSIAVLGISPLEENSPQFRMFDIDRMML